MKVFKPLADGINIDVNAGAFQLPALPSGACFRFTANAFHIRFGSSNVTISSSNGLFVNNIGGGGSGAAAEIYIIPPDGATHVVTDGATVNISYGYLLG